MNRCKIDIWSLASQNCMQEPRFQHKHTQMNQTGNQLLASGPITIEIYISKTRHPCRSLHTNNCQIWTNDTKICILATRNSEKFEKCMLNNEGRFFLRMYLFYRSRAYRNSTVSPVVGGWWLMKNTNIQICPIEPDIVNIWVKWDLKL